MGREKPADLLLLGVDGFTHELDGLLQGRARLVQGHIHRTACSLFEARSSRVLDLFEHEPDGVVRALLEGGEEVALEDFGPGAGNLSGKGVAKLDVQVSTPAAMAAQSYE